MNHIPVTFNIKDYNHKWPYHHFSLRLDRTGKPKQSELERKLAPYPKQWIKHGGIQERVDRAIQFNEYVINTNMNDYIADQAATEPPLPEIYTWNIPVKVIIAHAEFAVKQGHTGMDSLQSRLDNAKTTGEYAFWNNVIQQYLIIKSHGQYNP